MLQITKSDYSIQLISSSVEIANNTVLKLQPSFISSYIASISFEDVTYSNSDTLTTLVDATVSTVVFKNTVFSNITSSKAAAAVIRTAENSVFTVENLQYLASNVRYYLGTGGTGSVDGMTINTYKGTASIIQLFQVTNFTVSNFYMGNQTARRNLQVSGTATKKNHIIFIKDSYVESLSNVTLQAYSAMTLMYILRGSVNMMDSILIDSASQGLKFDNTNIGFINNLTIFNTGGLNKAKGPIVNLNSNTTIANSLFDTVSGQIGGAVNYY